MDYLDYEDYINFLSDRITELRMEKGVSARDMSLSLGQGAGYINNIENKRNLPSMTGFFYICDYFKISPQEFFNFQLHHPTKMRTTIENLQKLSKEDFLHIAAIIDTLAQKK